MNKSIAKEQTLIELCRAYISTLFAMSLGEKDFDGSSVVCRLDYVRVKIHGAIEEYYGIRDDKKRKQLRRIMGSLNMEIGFPIPEFEGYGKCTITRKELNENFTELVAGYGRKLAMRLEKEMNKIKITDLLKDESTEIIIYVAEACPACFQLKEHLNSNKIRFEMVDVNKNPEVVEQLNKAGFATLPLIRINGKLMAGDECDWDE